MSLMDPIWSLLLVLVTTRWLSLILALLAVLAILSVIEWAGVSAISTAIMAVVISISVYYVKLQLDLMKKTAKHENTVELIKFLQREETRKARGILIRLPVTAFARYEQYEQWTTEEIEAAEITCATYDVAGIMLSQELVDEDLLKRWHDSIVKCWNAAQPMIEAYRKERGDDYYKGFKDLFEFATRYDVQN